MDSKFFSEDMQNCSKCEDLLCPCKMLASYVQEKGLDNFLEEAYSYRLPEKVEQAYQCYLDKIDPDIYR